MAVSIADGHIPYSVDVLHRNNNKIANEDTWNISKRSEKALICWLEKWNFTYFTYNVSLPFSPSIFHKLTQLKGE